MGGDNGQELTFQMKEVAANVGGRRAALAILLSGVVLLVASIIASRTVVSWVEAFEISWGAAITITSTSGLVGFGLTAFGLLLVFDSDVEGKSSDPLEDVRDEIAELRREVAALRSRLEGDA